MTYISLPSPSELLYYKFLYVTKCFASIVSVIVSTSVEQWFEEYNTTIGRVYGIWTVYNNNRLKSPINRKNPIRLRNQYRHYIRQSIHNIPIMLTHQYLLVMYVSRDWIGSPMLVYGEYAPALLDNHKKCSCSSGPAPNSAKTLLGHAPI